MTAVIIVQARMNSTRLPGKVLKTLGGRTVLEHVLRRCQAIKGLDAVCCAVPQGGKNDPVADLAKRLGVHVFRGSENDVLDRYYQAARDLRADTVMRVTSDCPLLDPSVCAEVLALLLREGADYATNNMPPSWPHGLDCEAMTFAWLERSAREAQKPFEREHVSQYVRNHAQAKQVNLPCPEANVEPMRWTLDTPDDFVFLAALFERLPHGVDTDRAAWDWRVPLGVVRADPVLMTFNAGQDRWEGLNKSMAER